MCNKDKNVVLMIMTVKIFLTDSAKNMVLYGATAKLSMKEGRAIFFKTNKMSNWHVNPLKIEHYLVPDKIILTSHR